MTNPNKPLSTKPIPAPPGKSAKTPAPKAAPVPKEADEPRKRPKPAKPVVHRRSMVWQNISLIFAFLLLWTCWRFLYIRMKFGDELHFRPYDVLFVLLPSGAAFCLNWYWLREERTDVITKWSTLWAAIDLVLFGVTAFFASHPLHVWLTDLSNAASAT